MGNLSTPLMGSSALPNFFQVRSMTTNVFFVVIPPLQFLVRPFAKPPPPSEIGDVFVFFFFHLTLLLSASNLPEADAMARIDKSPLRQG